MANIDKTHIDKIIEDGRLVGSAMHLLKTEFKGKTIEELWKVEEKEVEKLCAPYDPALIVGLCIAIVKRQVLETN